VNSLLVVWILRTLRSESDTKYQTLCPARLPGRKWLERRANARVSNLFPGEARIGVCGEKSRIKSLDRQKTNGDLLISFVVSLSNHNKFGLGQRLPDASLRFEAMLCLSPHFSKRGSKSDARHISLNRNPVHQPKSRLRGNDDTKKPRCHRW
jgi:hypothetical protein